MDAAEIRELSDIATLRLQNKENTASSNKGGWLMISTILIEAWDYFAISFVLIFIKAEWSGITNWWLWGLATAAVQGGAIVGALLGGYVADQIGRKKMFIATMTVFIVFALIQGFTPTNGIVFLIVIRFLLGVPLGADIANGYAYIMESMSKGKREQMGVRWQFMFAAGEVIAILVVILLYVGGLHAHPEILWRIGLALGALPAVIVLFARLKLPETPLSLVQRGHFHEAKIASKELFDDSLDMMPDEDVKIDRVKTGDFLKVIWADKTKRRATVFGWISNAMQGGGSAGFLLYLPVIFLAIGLTGAATVKDYNSVVSVNLILAGVYCVAALSGWLAPWMLDKTGHRGLARTGFGAAFIGLIGIAISIIWHNAISASTAANATQEICEKGKFFWVNGACMTAAQGGSVVTSIPGFDFASALLVLFTAMFMWGHYWDASNGQTIVSLVAPPRFKATAGGFGYVFTKVASFFGAFIFPFIAGTAPGMTPHLVRASFFASLFSLVGFLAAQFILPEVYKYVETETAELEAKASA